MNKTVRIFIAITLHPKIQQTITKIQNHLKTLDCSVNWVKPENIHLTLKFLGNVELKMVETVKQALANAFANSKSIRTKLILLDAFPDLVHPRVLWVGLKDNKKKIAHLAASLENTFEKIDFKKNQKPFSPHITIGRTRSTKNLFLLSQTMSNYTLPPQSEQALQNVILYKSTLTSEGPLYELLYKIKLK